MLTGRQAFPSGQTVSDTIASILIHDPDLQALPATAPSRMRALVERCLRKDERRRWGDMADARFEIEEARAERVTTAVAAAAPKSARRRERLLALGAVVFFLTASGGLLWQGMAPRAAAGGHAAASTGSDRSQWNTGRQSGAGADFSRRSEDRVFRNAGWQAYDLGSPLGIRGPVSDEH
jgi:hypothetical protein